MPFDIYFLHHHISPHLIIKLRLIVCSFVKHLKQSPSIEAMNMHVTCHQEESRFLQQYAEKEQEEQTRRPVSFDPRVMVRGIPNLEEYTPSELASMYFAPNEYATIRDSIRSTLTALSNADGAIKGKLCLRGLECKTASGAAQKRGIRYLAWVSVLEAQEESQLSKGKTDSLLIARAYYEASSKSSSAACIRGLQDQMEAKEFRDGIARAA